jgi:glycosyltransferase involved in cell wall biosynthesis
MELGRALNGIPGWSSVLYCLEGSEMEEGARKFGLVVRVLPKRLWSGGGVIWNWRQVRSEFAKALKLVRPDVVINPMVTLRQTLFVPKVRGLGYRYALLVHEAVFRKGNSGLADRIGAMAQRFEIGRADLVVAMSDNTMRSLGPVGNAGKVIALVHPAFTAGVRKTLPAIVGKSGRIFFFGRTNRSKGIGRLLEAFRMLQGKMEVELDLSLRGAPMGGLDAGEGGINVSYGYLTEEELEKRIAAADVVALPYENASQSGVAARAMGIGCPCVATPVGGLPEQVIHGQTGHIARDMSAEAFASALFDLLTAGDHYSMAVEESLRLANDEFSWERFAREILEHLGEDPVETSAR